MGFPLLDGVVSSGDRTHRIYTVKIPKVRTEAQETIYFYIDLLYYIRIKK